jgi:NAD(P)H-hydrate epimerase
MRYVTAREMRELDERAVRDFGIPSLLLMENAGRACAEEILKFPVTGAVAVFAGKGNNGGDGFVAARHLWNRGRGVSVIYFQRPEEMKPDPLANFHILEKMKIPRFDFSEGWNEQAAAGILAQSAAVLDALFGTGLSKPLQGMFLQAIAAIHASRLPVAAVDVPSGLNSDTGEVMGSCVRADVTVTLGLPKKGLVSGEGPRFAGRVVVADISLPKELLAPQK